MSALDFFLYDNRTWSPQWGRDWGLKAATGVLADRADLKAAFKKYCDATTGEQGRLDGFGEAIGGMRSSSRDGYLLCVTLESADSFGRPSWAVFGLWCPGSVLEQTLSAGDPIGSVRALLGSETLPRAIEIRPAKTAAGPRRKWRGSAEPTFYRFESKSTVREVIALLLGAAQGIPPNVLGITATSRLAVVAQARFDVVYCLPMDDSAERALARVLSPQQPEAEEPEPAPPASTAPSSDRPPSRPEFRTARQSELSIFSDWIFWFAMALVAATVIFVVLHEIRRNVPSILGGTGLPAEEEVSSSGGGPIPEKQSAEVVLEEIGERLEECTELSPEDLRKSRGFKVAEGVEVLPEYQERRTRVRQAYATMIEVRDRMVKRQGNYVAYYYEEAGKDIAPATRVERIAEILGEAPLGSEDCAVLKDAFGFEFENGRSVVSRWCDALKKLEKTASTSRKLHNHQKIEDLRQEVK